MPKPPKIRIVTQRPVRRRRFVTRTAIADAASRAARIDFARFRADIDAIFDPRA